MSLLVVGTVALDTVKTPFGEVEEVLGGSATYFSVAASYFTEVHLVTVVGEDFPAEYMELLQRHRIDLKGLQREKGKTFRWKGQYDYDLNEAHTLDTQLNVLQTFKPQIPEEYRKIEYVFLANIDPDLQRDVLHQIERPKLVACDTMNFWIAGKPEALKRTLQEVDILIINDAETRQLAQEPNIVKAARKILSWGPHTLIIKRGEYGVLMFKRNEGMGKQEKGRGEERENSSPSTPLFSLSSVFAAPAYPLESVFDPTGAGDSFAGGFMGYLSKVNRIDEASLRQAIIFGSTIASFNVEDFSLKRLDKLSEEEIITRFREFKALVDFEHLG
ncbi:MAG TPA: PfkB family carbohydrate kinase [Candidatus Limnocylindrales bacterium]|nr:PfkB family carbohydrate kinase [Candidatus Limnocylindrales bacterium]